MGSVPTVGEVDIRPEEYWTTVLLKGSVDPGALIGRLGAGGASGETGLKLGSFFRSRKEEPFQSPEL